MSCSKLRHYVVPKWGDVNIHIVVYYTYGGSYGVSNKIDIFPFGLI